MEYLNGILLALAVACYTVGWFCKRAFRALRHRPQIYRWRRLVVPASAMLTGVLAGLSGAPGTGRLDQDLLWGIACGAGPIVWTSFSRGARRGRRYDGDD